MGAALKYVYRRTDGRKNGRGEANGRFSRRCERVYNGDETPNKLTGKTNYTHFVKACPRTEVPYLYGHSFGTLKLRLEYPPELFRTISWLNILQYNSINNQLDGTITIY